jgi:dolichyl-phosphate beta-glucosyltransferase
LPLSTARFSVVIPAFNEESGIAACIDGMREALERLGLAWEIVVVDDGSRDRTAAVVEERARGDARIRLIRGGRRGKGAAIRRGMLEARGDWRFMADADLSMPPDNLDRFVAAVSRQPVPHIVIGSREAAGAQRLGEPWQRHLVGRLFNWLVQLIAIPGVRDTQCGYKLFSAQSAAALFPHMRVEGFAFDVEALLLARRAGFDMCELGITWRCRRDTRVGLGRGVTAFGDLLRIRWNAWTGRYNAVRALDSCSPPEALRNACC